MASKQISDTEVFTQIKRQAESIVQSYGDRNIIIKRMDEMYQMIMERPKSADSDLKLTISPDARNTVQGIVRLMTATAPTFSIPSAENADDADAYSEQMELAAGAMWAGSNQAQSVTVEKDICQSLALYDEAYVGITCVSEISEALKERDQAGDMSWLNDSVHELAAEVPYLYSIIPPKEAYPLMGRLGMLCFVRRQDITVTELLELYGGMATKAIGSRGKASTVTVTEYWDNIYHAVWLQGNDVILPPTKHGLGFIPIAFKIANGTRLYREPHLQRQPLLLGLERSGLWRDKNVVLTATMNKVRAFGLNAQFIFQQSSADQEPPRLDFSENGGIMITPPGSRLDQMQTGMIDNTTIGTLSMIDGMIGDSTIYKQALGAPVSGQLAYSTISLLSQAGRLPLVPIQEAAEDILSSAMRMTMKWIKFKGETATAYKQAESVEIDPAQIPERVVFHCSMDVDLPQDMLRNANIATMLKQAMLVDDKWIHENILKVGQTTDMKKRIVAQQVSDLLIKDTVEKFLKQWQQATAPKQPQQSPPMQGQPGQPPVSGPGFDPSQGGMSSVEANGMQSGDQAQSMPNGFNPETLSQGGM